MVTAEDVIQLYKKLNAHNIQIWLTGGWGIDALLDEQTRSHKDLDVIMLLDDIVRMQTLLSKEGFALKELWSENRFVEDASGNRIATAFVLEDSEGREFDAHAITFDDQGNGIPAWDESSDFMFTKEDLTGVGVVAGHPVQCITAKSQIICHTGYKLPEYQWDDLKRLHEKFDVGFPDGIS